jgi:hypothetical protein
MSKQIAYRFFAKSSAPIYVGNLKGDGGADWGYVTDIQKAIPLNHNQWQSFAKDMRECGSAAFALHYDDPAEQQKQLKKINSK